ncbi:MAG: Acidobacterial duplicated orphan permease (function unknown) [uncultured Cytophagales bacterium]|uniref:Uncharacterized protein n=1 Tax=uncultured Cytophagales bacterium TaxID=158755 RepID=A0A6J4K6P3_9SPHI|nr:MAG: Acidobacterial duplicated orphan permease (function unknown) [uncultured Cytophagales bacterium]
MIRHYLITAWRSLQRNKTASGINLLGLTIGIAASLLIARHVVYQLSYDRFHRKGRDIYRVTTEWYEGNTRAEAKALTVPWTGPGMQAAFPDVLAYGRLAPVNAFVSKIVMRYKASAFTEKRAFFADQGLLDMLTLEWTRGRPATALKQPYSVVLTESAARRYFRGEDPVGKTLAFKTSQLQQQAYQVTGVVKDLPANSHLHFDLLLSFNSLPEGLSAGSSYWFWDYTYNYVLLHPRADPAVLGREASGLLLRQFGDQMPRDGRRPKFVLQPLYDIHLHSRLTYEPGPNGDYQSVQFLVLIALFILLIAHINAINLATARSLDRAREIGIRKVLGSLRGQLIGQFMLESLLLNGAAIVLALGLVEAGLPLVERLTGNDFAAARLDGAGMALAAALVGTGLLAGSFLAGLYPAFVLSSFKPISALKGRTGGPGRGVHVRQALVAFQFAFSVILLAATFAAYQQLRFMEHRDLGIHTNGVLVVEGPNVAEKDWTFAPAFAVFKQRLMQHPRVRQVTGSSFVPGEELSGESVNFTRAGEAPGQSRNVRIVLVDHNFFETYGIRLLAGRNYDPTFGTDRDAVILNEAAAALVGFRSPAEAAASVVVWHNGLFKDDGFRSPVVGVVNNHNQLSPKSAYIPTVYLQREFHNKTWARDYFSIRFDAGPGSPAALADLVAAARAEWKEVYPDAPFGYFFLDAFFNRQYQPDRQLGGIFGGFAGLAVFIACLGLYGLAAVTTGQRTKEVGIRKVLGASLPGLTLLLTRDFVKLVALGTLVAWPFAYWGVHAWLAGYAFRTTVGWDIFLLPGGLVLLVTLLTVGGHTLRVARANPADSLRYE